MKHQSSLLRSIAIPCALTAASMSSVQGTTLYSIGEPTAKEQLYVELINRARANPTAEGVWLNSLYTNADYPNITFAYDYFKVDRTLMQAEFVTGSSSGKPVLNVTPPLAINSKITDAARLHSQNQIDNDFQGHRTDNIPNGEQASARMAAQGYPIAAWSENVFVASKNVVFGHAGFQVDWGLFDNSTPPQPISPGMQDPRGHRSAIHGSAYREVGVGNLTTATVSIPSGNTDAIGPEVVTQDFGTQPADTPFITGVAYYDLNSNNFYDVGEGIGGINVTVTGASYHAVTSTSGGYTIPMSGNGTHTVSFDPSFSTSSTDYSVTITGNENQKQDLILTYSAPDLTGPTQVSSGDSVNYDIDLVPGASSYTWQYGLVDDTPQTEDGDQGSGGYTLDTSSLYTTVQSNTSASGNAFRLLQSLHANYNITNDQIVTLSRTFTPGASASLGFKSRVSSHTIDQFCKVQISEDGGTTWSDTTFNQQGTNSAGESSFNDRTVDLSGSVGKSVMIRFILAYQPVVTGLFQVDPNSPTPAGWYIDDITFSDMEEITAPVESIVASGNSFLFTPAAVGTYRLSARADLLGGPLPYGDTVDVRVVSSDFSGWLNDNPAATGGNSGDPELDGISNLIEYAFGLDPEVADAHSLPHATKTATHITLSASYPSHNHDDITYAIQRSTSLMPDSWTTVKTFTGGEALTYSAPYSSRDVYFYRWKITLNP